MYRNAIKRVDTFIKKEKYYQKKKKEKKIL